MTDATAWSTEPVEIRNPARVMAMAKGLARKHAGGYGLCESDLEDIAAAVVLRAVDRARFGFVPSRRVLRWYTLRAIEHMRTTWREVRVEADEVEARGPSVDPEPVSLALHQLQRAWPSMSAHQRAAMTLRLQGHSNEEIGEAIGVTADAVNATLYYARKHVNGEAGDHGPARAAAIAARSGKSCEVCATRLSDPPPGAKVGKPRKHCSAACTARAYRARKVAA
jgi:DNA-directed RNA polymerase specialized sigma24 family protein